MQKPELIYCAAGNKRFAKIAIDAGFTYGAQIPNKVHYPIEFADQDWEKPDLTKYLNSIKEHKPRLATVLDFEQIDQFDEVLMWAETIAPYVETIIIIPKCFGGIAMLPNKIKGKEVRLGYSVPTRYGGTIVPFREFGDWPVHLLGGSPKKQRRLTSFLNVVSLDGNYHQLMATKFNTYFDSRITWQRLDETIGNVKKDAPYKAFELSCEGIMSMWNNDTEMVWGY